MFVVLADARAPTGVAIVQARLAAGEDAIILDPCESGTAAAAGCADVRPDRDGTGLTDAGRLN